MSTTTFCPTCPPILISPVGFSDDAMRLAKFLELGYSEIRQSETFGRQNKILEELDNVFEKCSVPGWDGYDAQPISLEAYSEATKLIRSLPLVSFIPSPDIVPEPSGEIALEWYKSNRQVFVASVKGKGEIEYAGLFGFNKTNGIEYFNDILPATILENLRRLYL